MGRLFGGGGVAAPHRGDVHGLGDGPGAPPPPSCTDDRAEDPRRRDDSGEGRSGLRGGGVASLKPLNTTHLDDEQLGGQGLV